MVGPSRLSLLDIAIALTPVPRELLSNFNNADPLVLPRLTIVMCRLSMASTAGVRLIRLLLQARLVLPKANASEVGCGSLPDRKKNFTLFTTLVMFL